MPHKNVAYHTIPIAVIVLAMFCGLRAEPIVINGSMVQALLGSSIEAIRVLNDRGEAIPFQVDEMTRDGEYVCDLGKQPNADSGNGILDPQDEVVFLWEDASQENPGRAPGVVAGKSKTVRLDIERLGAIRSVVVMSDSLRALSPVHYIEYNHEQQQIRTPYFYAQFGKNRFHFTKAGLKDFSSGKYVDVTGELRIEILLKALWGLIPIRYTEENLFCFVKRYKAGPVRLIRRGDFHLNLGLGIKGSRAAVNQLCYPQVVKVPVYIHLPIRFKVLFSEAYVEMTPVIKSTAHDYTFGVPAHGIDMKLSGSPIDTVVAKNPNKSFMTVQDGTRGYGWVLQAGMNDSLLSGSGYVVRRPSERGAMAECGYRLVVRELAKGYYQIINWVLFSQESATGLDQEYGAILKPSTIRSGSGQSSMNRFCAGTVYRRP